MDHFIISTLSGALAGQKALFGLVRVTSVDLHGFLTALYDVALSFVG